MKNTKLQQGFTLIEVAIVVALIMVLALIAYPVYSHFIKKDNSDENVALATTTTITVAHRS